MRSLISSWAGFSAAASRAAAASWRSRSLLVHRLGQPVLQVADLAAGLGHELVDPPTAVAAHLSLEQIVLVRVGVEVAMFAHGSHPSRVQANPAGSALPN